jgi:hypothetical protein
MLLSSPQRQDAILFYLGKRGYNEALGPHSIPILKTKTAFYNAVVEEAVPFDFIEDWQWDDVGSPDPFFRADQIIKLRAGEKEKHLVARIYPLLHKKLVIDNFPANYVLMNGEKYSSIPPNLLRDYDSKAKWFSPDLFILPSYLVNYRAPTARSPMVSEGVEYVYGNLNIIDTYPYTVILDAKVHPISTDDIGDFFHCFYAPTQWYLCQMRGMLFSQREFILVNFVNGKLTYFCRGTWISPGSLGLVTSFLSKHSEKLYRCLEKAVHHYNRRAEEEKKQKEEEDDLHKIFPPLIPFPHSSQNELGYGSALLGVGASGIVFDFIDGKNRHFALKIVIGNHLRKDHMEVEFTMAETLQNNPIATQSVVGVVPNSLYDSSVKLSGIDIEFHCYLMPMVGIPFPTIGKVTIPAVHKQEILKALSRIHAAKYIHGDARYVNCVAFPKTGKTKESYRWVDFSGCQIYCDNFVKKDFRLLLESFDFEFSEENEQELSEYFNAYLEVVQDIKNATRLDDFCKYIFS